MLTATCPNPISPHLHSPLRIVRPLSRLRKLLMLRQRHISITPIKSALTLPTHLPPPLGGNSPPQLNQNSLHRILPLPLKQTRQPRRIHLPTPLIDTREIDFRDKLDCGWDVGVLVSAVDVEAVDAVLVGALERGGLVCGGKGRGGMANVWGAEDGAVPV